MRCAVLCSALIVVGAVTGGCFRENRGTVQQAEVSWLEFRGAVDGAEFRLADEDDRTLVELTAVRTGVRFSVAPGTVVLVVRRGQAEIVRRKLFLVAGESREVRIP
jgi:hypothetical protein